MKRSILALALILVLSASVGCTKHRQYTTDGTYYLDGTVIQRTAINGTMTQIPLTETV